MSTTHSTSPNVIVTARKSRPPGVVRQPIQTHNVTTGDKGIPPFARRCPRCLTVIFSRYGRRASKCPRCRR